MHNDKNPAFETDTESFKNSTAIATIVEEQFANNSEFDIQTRIEEQDDEIVNVCFLGVGMVKMQRAIVFFFSFYVVV